MSPLPVSPPIFPFVLLEHLSMTIDLNDKSWGGEKGHFVLSYLGSLYTWVYFFRIESGIWIEYFCCCFLAAWFCGRPCRYLVNYLGPDPCKGGHSLDLRKFPRWEFLSTERCLQSSFMRRCTHLAGYRPWELTGTGFFNLLNCIFLYALSPSLPCCWGKRLCCLGLFWNKNFIYSQSSLLPVNYCKLILF